MRLGIKGKQVLGVTSIVGAVVVVLSVLHLARLAQREPRREPGARRAAGERDLSPRARGRRSTAPIRTRRCAPIPGCARFSSRASIRRTSPSRRSSTPRRRRRARRSVARRAAAAAGRRSRKLLAAAAALAAARDLLEPGTEPRVPPAAAARRHRVRVDPHRRLDAADPRRTRRVARPGARHRAGRAGGVGARRDRCWRSCCCGRST